MDGRRQQKRGDLLIDGGLLSAIGGVASTAGALITETSHVLLPGLVQAHVHLDQALLNRDFVPSLDPWRFQLVQLSTFLAAQDEASLSAQAESAIGRGLLAGATTYGDAGLTASRPGIEAALRLGARLVVAVDATVGAPARVLDALDTALARREGGLRIRFALFAGAAERTPISALAAASRLAQERSLPLIVHSGELPGDGGGIRRLERAHALTRSLVLCHARSPELARHAKVLAECGATIVLTPASDLLFGAPRPPLEAFVEAGVNLALGSDGGASRIAFDPFRELRLLLRLFRGRVSSPATTALEIATRGGARALGLNAGAVEVGRAADLVAIDVAAQDGEEHEALAVRIIEEGGPERVRTVWVDGQVVAADGRLVSGSLPREVDERALRQRLLASQPAPAPLKARARAGVRSLIGGSRRWVS